MRGAAHSRVAALHRHSLGSQAKPLEDGVQFRAALELLVVHARRERLQREAVRRIRVHDRRERGQLHVARHRDCNLRNHLPGDWRDDGGTENVASLRPVDDLDEAVLLTLADCAIHVPELAHDGADRALAKLRHGRRLAQPDVRDLRRGERAAGHLGGLHAGVRER
eukprot:4640491-Prymnesium_polylepis.1